MLVLSRVAETGVLTSVLAFLLRVVSLARGIRAVLSWDGVIEEEGLNEFAGQSSAHLFCWAG
ncbi:MAG: hypothetical protein BWX48_01310 [Verrucomicrobia bacterium ADurb.Bin006]|jgi:hypothetical protein|nr:MAG: hypothetical protein BWX48_01310 [Verrucomicrobia bacterium ADurb.Bin006]